MKHFNSIRSALCGAAILMTASCTSDFFSSSPAVTTDAKYVGGALAAWSASLATGESAEDPSLMMTSDDQTTLSNRAAQAATVVDNGDGTVTITKSANHYAGFPVTKVITRAKKPSVADVGAGGAELTKSGSEKWYVGAVSGTPIADITLSLVWTNNAGTVELKSLARSGERLGLGNSTHPEILTVVATYTAGAMATKTVTHYSTSVAAGNLLFTEEFAYTAATDSDPAVTTITRKDATGTVKGSKRVTIDNAAKTQTVERMNALGVLREKRVNMQTDSGWTRTSTIYKIDGVTIKATSSETAVVTQDGETTTMERTVTTDSVVRLVKVSLTLIDSGYTVVVTAADGSTTSWTATQTAEGTWTLTDAAGAATTVNADEVI